ncbi:hypothetical protein BASA62_006540, partial [Batrachochytrium salamandrivorans]
GYDSLVQVERTVRTEARLRARRILRRRREKDSRRCRLRTGDALLLSVWVYSFLVECLPVMSVSPTKRPGGSFWMPKGAGGAIAAQRQRGDGDTRGAKGQRGGKPRKVESAREML